VLVVAYLGQNRVGVILSDMETRILGAGPRAPPQTSGSAAGDDHRSDTMDLEKLFVG